MGESGEPIRQTVGLDVIPKRFAGNECGLLVALVAARIGRDPPQLCAQLTQLPCHLLVAVSQSIPLTP